MFEWEDYGDSFDGNQGQKQGDFIKPKPGSYLAEVGEGIELRLSTKSKKYSIWVPLKLTKVLEDERGNGSPDAVGAEVVDFISPSYDFTMKRLGFLISCSKYRADFTKKYAGIPGMEDQEFDQFIMDVKRYLPSTKVCVFLAMSTGTEKPMVQVKSYWKPQSTGPAVGQQDRPGW